MAEDLSINKNKIFTQRYGNSNNDICRLCLKNEAHMEPLFYSNLFPNILLTKKIYDCTSIQIIYERNLPMFVCKLCANKLDEYVRFRDRCIANDEFLRNALAAFDANGGGNCTGAIKMEPEDTPPPPSSAPTTAKFSQCLAVTPMELNCALVAAAAAAAAGHQASKREPPDVEDEGPGSYGRGSGAPSPDRSSCGRVTADELSVKRSHADEHYRSGDEEELPTDDGYGGEPATDHGDHQYVCEVCSKSFKIRHHLLVKPYKCHLCLKSFTVLDNLTAHSAKCLKDKFRCTLCSKSVPPSAPATPVSESIPGSPSPGTGASLSTVASSAVGSANGTPTLSEALSDLLRYEIALRAPLELQQMLLGHIDRKGKPQPTAGGKAAGRRYRCDVCFKGYSQYPSLIKHRKLHFKVPPLVKVLAGKGHHADYEDGGEELAVGYTYREAVLTNRQTMALDC
uniref:Uncharacterized protein n=1 Tax=Anopheles christyi TaxID=43041 RepID=A0A182K7U0_9DIPT